MALKTAVRYEQPGATGWLRREGRTLPAGTTTGAPATAETKTVYYGDTDTAPAVCGIPAGTPVSVEAVDARLSARQRGFGRGARQQIEHDRVRFTRTDSIASWSRQRLYP